MSNSTSGLLQPDDGAGADEVFCLTDLWDTNLTWHPEPGTPPDFTPCFHKTVLVYAPCAVLWLLIPFEAALLQHLAPPAGRPFSRIPWTRLSLVKVLLTCVLIATSMATLFMVLMSRDTAEVTGADIVAPPVKMATYLVSLLLMVNAKKRGHVTSGVQFTFWLLLATCQTATLGSLLYRGGKGFLTVSETQSRLLATDCLLILVIFILNCWADNPPGTKDLQDGSRKKSPEYTSSFLNYILFTWFDMTVWRAKNSPIADSDLWDLNEEDSIRTLIPMWSKLWESEKKKMSASEAGYQQSDFGCRSSSGYQRLDPEKRSKKPGIAVCIMKAFKWSFFLGFLWQLAYVVVQFISPLVLDLIIELVKDPAQEDWKGYMYTAILCLVSLMSAVFDSLYWSSMKKVGLRIRTAVNGAVYRKILRLSNVSKRTMTAGDVINLISVDCQKLQEAMLFVNFLWACPLQVGLAIYFLYIYLGWSVFVGLAVLLILIPINAIVCVFMEKYQAKQMVKKDSRVRLITEVLSGIKVLKLFAWEEAFTQRIDGIRQGELKDLKAFQYLEASQFFAWNIAPTMVALSTFGTYVLANGGVLDPKVAFVSLALFIKMRGPLYLLPSGIANLIQGGVACKRIDKFLNAEEMDPNSVSRDNRKAHPVQLQHASFSWGAKDDEPPTLRDLNLTVVSGSLTAVVGVVGSGKSSLLSALLGSMTRVSGMANVRQKETVAYVPQLAWMQNATLQENILFGKPLRNDLYQKTLDACALRPDLEILGGGDQTEIGEKGINVSGGQKQRISVARAVYSDSSLYLLDDPLSAVDSHVGKHIFQEVLGPRGLLRDKTRVLVTHAISYLPQVDEIVVMKDGTISERGTYAELLASGGAFADFLIEQLQLEQEKLDRHDDDDDDVGGGGHGERAASMSESEVESLKHDLEATLGKDRLQERLAPGKYTGGSSRTYSRSSSAVAAGPPSSTTTSRGHVRTTNQQQQQQKFPPGSNGIHRADEVAADVLGDKTRGALVVEEHAETNAVGLSVYLYYARSLGPLAVILGTGFYFLFQASMVGGNIWLSVWSGDEEAAADMDKQGFYLAVFGGLGLVQSVAILVAIVALTLGSLRASERLHQSMLDHVLRSTSAFFDTTPTGRIINRFSKDIDEIDLMLPTGVKDVFDFSFSTLATGFVVCYTNLYTLALMPVLVALALLVQTRYLTLSRQLKRMVSVTRSPINSGLTESFSGAATICAFDRVQDFVRRNDELVEANQRYFYPELVSDSWLFSRLQTVANLLILFVALFSIVQRETIDPGLVGLSLSYAFTCQLDIFLLTRRFADTEKSIVSVERVKEYHATPVEAPRELESDRDLPEQWPQDGALEFRDYAARYRPGLDLVLRGVSFRIEAGVKVGVVGRTGAGKSSLALSLFRLIEAADDHPGYISLDGINIAQVGLRRLRNILTIIPQDPVLFSGTLRFNLDPRHQFDDGQVWRALEIAHLKDFVTSTTRGPSTDGCRGLDLPIYDGGENLSVGQRQLVCLARALLRKTKVLILDEATAAVDLETDDFIQEAIRTEFKECTVLTIAHRLKTIMDYDQILVLDNGKVAEFDTPATLLANPASAFHAMALDAGVKTP